jgi:two-component system sensor histidine kinase/response regulator
LNPLELTPPLDLKSLAWSFAAPPRVLVVDDQPANIQIVGSMLGKQGYEITPASDGAAALRELAMRVPDLILLDVLMPGLDGIEVCRQIRRNPEWNDIPVIFLSAADDKDLIVRALEAGGVDYVTKPFNDAEMLTRARTQLALKMARDRLKQLAEDKDELIGILAHDLKSHLGGMQLSAGILRERAARLGDPKQKQLCDNICNSAERLLGFVREYLANAAADHGIAIKPGSVSLGEAASRVGQGYMETARRKGLELIVSTPPQPVLVMADRVALDQVLDNLLSNAIKFSPPDRSISISVRATETGGECIVQDQGPGFSTDDMARMFRRYGRLSARPTGGEPSTGLGLSIVRKLVLKMNGELTCDSKPGQGAIFTVRFLRTNHSD